MEPAENASPRKQKKKTNHNNLVKRNNRHSYHQDGLFRFMLVWWSMIGYTATCLEKKMTLLMIKTFQKLF